MSRFFILATLCLLFNFLQAQTKLIAHKRHSGSHQTFSMALEEGVFEAANSNFGMAPEPMVTTASLDSVIFLSDSVAVMVTSEQCKRRNRTTKWKAGADTVYNHFLFNRKNSDAFIRDYLQRYYHFKNPIDSVKLIDRAEGQSVEYQSLPAGITKHDDDNNTASRNQPFKWLAILALFAATVGGLYYLLFQLNSAGRLTQVP